MSIALKRRYTKGFRLSREKIKPLCRAEKPPFQFHEKPLCLAPPAFRTQHLYYQTERILSKRNAENERLPKTPPAPRFEHIEAGLFLFRAGAISLPRRGRCSCNAPEKNLKKGLQSTPRKGKMSRGRSRRTAYMKAAQGRVDNNGRGK